MKAASTRPVGRSGGSRLWCQVGGVESDKTLDLFLGQRLVVSSVVPAGLKDLFRTRQARAHELPFKMSRMCEPRDFLGFGFFESFASPD